MYISDQNLLTDYIFFVRWLISSHKHIDVDTASTTIRILYLDDTVTVSNLAIVQICVSHTHINTSQSNISLRRLVSILGSHIYTFATEWISHCNMALPCLHFIWCDPIFIYIYTQQQMRITFRPLGKYDNIRNGIENIFWWTHWTCIIISSFSYFLSVLLFSFCSIPFEINVSYYKLRRI